MCADASGTSTRLAIFIGLPLSSDSSWASSSAFASIASAKASIARVRSAAAMPLQRPPQRPSRAARTARSTSSVPACGTSVITRPVAGSKVSRCGRRRPRPLAADQQAVRARRERAGMFAFGA